MTTFLDFIVMLIFSACMSFVFLLLAYTAGLALSEGVKAGMPPLEIKVNHCVQEGSVK